jgi:hypothetical protein
MVDHVDIQQELLMNCSLRYSTDTALDQSTFIVRPRKAERINLMVGQLMRRLIIWSEKKLCLASIQDVVENVGKYVDFNVIKVHGRRPAWSVSVS